MLFDNYDTLVRGIPFYEKFISIFHMLDNVLTINNIDNPKQTISYLKETNVVKEINDLQIKLVRERDSLLVSPVASLASNLRGLISNERENDRNGIIKSKKTLLSFINFEYASVTYTKIVEYLNMTLEERDRRGSKLVLVAGTTDLNDRIFVNEEIHRIYDISKESMYYVVPLLGCTLEVFKTYITKYKFDYVHIAGHGTQNGYICFQGANAKPTTVERVFLQSNKSIDMLFINCCHSRLFYDQISDKSLSACYITYKDELSSQHALDFSNAFYTSKFWGDNKIRDSFDVAQSNHNDNNYELN